MPVPLTPWYGAWLPWLLSPPNLYFSTVWLLSCFHSPPDSPFSLPSHPTWWCESPGAQGLIPLVTFTGRGLGPLSAEKRRHSGDVIVDCGKLKDCVFISREVLLYAVLMRGRRNYSRGLKKGLPPDDSYLQMSQEPWVRLAGSGGGQGYWGGGTD